ncbi:Na+ ATPase [Actinomortierella ambigua]|uniref:P-type Na(+) transporter n=1 Tax=Actinomortierella ambigua TaxID=1343610 RepID=A0A9P6UCY8_9FUNG|nr:Na+ ATPase [Actinomortierella ambigua]
MGKTVVEIQEEVPYHTLTVAETEAQLKTSIVEGLTTEEAETRLRRYGTNELKGNGGVKWYKVLWRQIANPLVVVLMIANILAFATSQFAEGGVILFIIIMNATIGFYQDFSAEQTMEALRNMSSPTSQVIRDENRTVIPNNQVVPGDIMIFEDGDVIGADCRLFEVFNLETDEALLTGESLPAQKNLDQIKSTEQPLGDRLNMVFSSTTVVKGRAKGIVTSTGMATQIGKIATTLMNVSTNELTPLQKRLNKMAYFIMVAAVVLVIVVFGVHGFRYSTEIAIYAISVAISMIPQGLVAIVTLTMAFGVRRMAHAKAIVRRLSSLESLGAVTNICSDKTGTLTESKMVAVRMWFPGDGFYRVSGTGFIPEGEIFYQGHTMNSKPQIQEEKVTIASGSDQLLRALQAAALCNMAELRKTNHPETHGEWTAIGDPTEIALQVLAYKAGVPKPELIENGFQLIAEFPFDSSVKRMSVLYKTDSGEYFIFTKGATERVIGRCSHYRHGESEIPLENEKADSVQPDFKSTIMDSVDALAEQGLRVLTLSYRKFTPTPGVDLVHGLDREEVESDLVFLGLVGIYDPPREESLPAVMRCYEAGIRVHMLTGDHPSTAAAIAKEVAIIPADTNVKTSPMVMSADMFDSMTEEQIDALEELPRVVARCSPNTKVKMIAALHRRKLFAAMTGDGVNDSPSLKAANVGIAMGQSGSDVAKQAADIVLTDDNFATIVDAIAEGRRMFYNIQKFVQHLMSGNIATILVLVVALAVKDNQNDSVFPLSAAAILFMNLCYSSPPAIGLGLEPASAMNMKEPPRTSKQGLFSFEVLLDMGVYGLVMAILSFVPFIIVLFVFEDGEMGVKCNAGYSPGCDGVFRARATCYATLTFLILSHAINCRDIRESGWKWSRLKTVHHNKMLWLSIVIGALILIPVIYVPGLNKNVFKHLAITYEWGLVFASLFIYTAFVELYKFIKRRTMA